MLAGWEFAGLAVAAFTSVVAMTPDASDKTIDTIGLVGIAGVLLYGASAFLLDGWMQIAGKIVTGIVAGLGANAGFGVIVGRAFKGPE